MCTYITGIQQCGIGVKDALEAAHYYKEIFGFTAVVFDDVAEAHLMTQYTGNKIYKRRAILTMNMQGGGGLEMWQFSDRKPSPALQRIKAGDPGINAIKIKTRDVQLALEFFKTRKDVTVLSVPILVPEQKSFFVEDKYENVFQIVEKDNFFTTSTHVCAGVCGAIIGVTDIKKSTIFYNELFGFTSTPVRQIMNSLIGDKQPLLQTSLFKPVSQVGAFAQLLGDTEIELWQTLNTVPPHIFKNRYWGDLGFIHICFDVLQMNALKSLSEKKNHRFTVDSEVFFEMEKAGGRFCYLEDPDGTLVELVQTFKVPILKKLGLYLNLQLRKKNTPLPKWMVKLLGVNKL